METMLDKITGKKRPEGDETATERPEGTHGPSGNGEEENVVGDENDAQLQNELENLKKTYELMLAGDYESVKDASGAGYSPKKQEGNVHGYEQEEVMEAGEAVGKTDIKSGINKKKTESVKKVYVETIAIKEGEQLQNKELTNRLTIIVMNYESYMPNSMKPCMIKLKIRANLNNTEYIFGTYVEGKIELTEMKGKIQHGLKFIKDFVIIGDKAKIGFKKGLLYKMQANE